MPGPPNSRGKSRCLYCNSGSYGRGCIYSPHKHHVHSGDNSRCIYCGSKNYGIGCIYNPFAKKSAQRLHVHGSEYNQMLNEQKQNMGALGLLVRRMFQPISESAAYKLGLIDEKGNRLKIASTIEEKNACSPVTQLFLKIRSFVGAKLEMMNESLYLEATMASATTVDQYEAEAEIRRKAEKLAREYYDLLGEAHQRGLSQDIVDNICLESFLKKNE